MKIPNIGEFSKEDLEILDIFKNNFDELKTKIDSQNVNFYLNFIVEQLFRANKYFNDQEP